jgi:small subunit ribosomal protein S15
MARIYSKKHGKAKSRKPPAEAVSIPSNAPTKEQIEALIVQYAKQGMDPALIGEKLKKEHNVPYIKHMLGERLTAFLNRSGFKGEMPSDLLVLMKKAVKMHEHMARNKQDQHNKTSLHRVESKIWRLTKYYRREGALPKDWKYDPKEAALLIKGSL